MKRKLFLLFVVFALFSCSSPKKVIRFTQKPQDVFTNNNLRTFLRNNPNPNIVLRVPNTQDQVTTKTNNPQINNDVYFNAIEKELLKAGFSVRDRGLFNEVLQKMQRNSQQNIDYSQINELTNTDLILEVIKIDRSVKYATNKTSTINKKGVWKETTSYREYKTPGATAEFKIILVKNNEMAGTYTFNYTPCVNGCELASFKLKSGKLVKKGASASDPYEFVDEDQMEKFISGCTIDLINAIKG